MKSRLGVLQPSSQCLTSSQADTKVTSLLAEKLPIVLCLPCARSPHGLKNKWRAFARFCCAAVSHQLLPPMHLATHMFLESGISLRLFHFFMLEVDLPASRQSLLRPLAKGASLLASFEVSERPRLTCARVLCG